MRAYNELYLADAQENMGALFDWAVNAQLLELESFFSLFVQSGLAEAFGRGDPSIIAGRSGEELGMMTLDSAGIAIKPVPEQDAMQRSPEFWAGWVYAFYQWETAIPFAQLAQVAPVEKVAELYNPYHEMDIRQACDRVDLMVCNAQPHTNLKLARECAGLSQADLARSSGVSVRTIQHYEQRSKDINKASWDTLTALSRALRCKPEDIVELLPRERYTYHYVRI